MTVNAIQAWRALIFDMMIFYPVTRLFWFVSNVIGLHAIMPVLLDGMIRRCALMRKQERDISIVKNAEAAEHVCAHAH